MYECAIEENNRFREPVIKLFGKAKMNMCRRESGKAGFGLKRNAEKQENKQATPTPQQAPRPEHAATVIPDTANLDKQEPRGKE